jgi:hypothetical protein
MLARLGQVLCGVGIVTVALLGCADHAPRPAPIVEIMAMINGSVKLEGTEFTDADTLRAKLIEIEARKPSPDFRLDVQDTTKIENWLPAISLLQKTRTLPVGFTLYAPNSATKP